jgi:replication factor C subunit 2/4
MIIKYPRINSDNLYQKIESICINENVPYTEDGINTLIFVSDKDIRQAINNMECIFYSFGKLETKYIYKLIDKPKPYYISEIIKGCIDNNYSIVIGIVKGLCNKGYTPNDILLTFMKYLFENTNNDNLNETTRLKMYEIISMNYIRVNGGIDTLLQLCGCISKIFIYLQNEKK